MSLKLYYHPLSSFCWKVLIPLYENSTPFEKHFVDLGDPAARAAFLEVWPVGKFPVLRDAARDWTVPESSIIIEYLQQHYPGPVRFLPDDPDLARQVRMRDRFLDLYVHLPMQTVVGDRLRPEGQKDSYGVEQARARIATALGTLEQDLAGKTWMMGESFSMADCAAAPALYYTDKVQPYGDTHPNVAAYRRRLMERPSFVRVLEEARPYFHLFPG